LACADDIGIMARKMPGICGREIGVMLQGIGAAGRSFWRRPWLKRGCCANDDDDDCRVE